MFPRKHKNVSAIIYHNYVLLIHTDLTQAAEILHHVVQELSYST